MGTRSQPELKEEAALRKAKRADLRARIRAHAAANPDMKPKDISRYFRVSHNLVGRILKEAAP